MPRIPGASVQLFFRLWLLHCAAVAIAVTLTSPVLVYAQDRGGYGGSGHGSRVYQRHAFDWKDDRGRSFSKHHGRAPTWVSPQVSSGWFQRPYPYHLDYYKMRYGGSYAPYFGNLYGPPQVVTAPPYFGPYYGNFGYGDPNLAAPPGEPGGMPGGYLNFPNGAVFEGPNQGAAPSDQPINRANGEGLPTP